MWASGKWIRTLVGLKPAAEKEKPGGGRARKWSRQWQSSSCGQRGTAAGKPSASEVSETSSLAADALSSIVTAVVRAPPRDFRLIRQEWAGPQLAGAPPAHPPPPSTPAASRLLLAIYSDRRRLDDEWKRPPEERTVHPDCINASNPYHDCSEYCFKRIADAKLGSERGEQEPPAGGSGKSDVALDQADGDAGRQEDAGADDGYLQMTEKQKKLFELRLKMNEARKANQQAMVAEKKRMEPRPESRGVSKQKWLEDRKKKIGKLLDSNGLDLSKSFMLDTQESAEAKYKKWEKEPAPYGWDVFNQKTLYDAYKKRTKNIEVDMDAYNKAKEADPEFYRDASSLQYGKLSKVPEENIDRMVNELKERDEKRKSFRSEHEFFRSIYNHSWRPYSPIC